MGITRALVLAIAVGCGVGGCGTDKTPDVIAAIRQSVAAAGPTDVSSSVWEDVGHFYERRAYEPTWVLDPTRAAEALGLLRRAPEHGLVLADYGEDALARAFSSLEKENTPESAQDIARLDMELTGALLSLGRDVALGRTQPDAMDARWKAMRTPPDLPGSLSQAVTAGLATWLDSIRPRHPEYAALQKLLAGATAPDAQLIALNMDRWRWMPDELGDQHILVNIPAFHMAARENGKAVLDMKVVVGTRDHATPIFSGNMKTIVFSPYWNVPDSIAEDETAPAAARDPQYLARNNIEILRISKGDTAIVNPSDVDWDDPDELKALSFRQRPGADNALGHVKFLFPNKYDVYLHDTPADALFARAGRALSHGCVRLEQPEELANYVLRDRPEWNAERIREAMHAGTEKQLALKDEIPVHIVYFTVWPNGAGGVDTWADLYGFDAKQADNIGRNAGRERPETK